MGLIRQKDYPFVFDPAACRDCAGFCCRGKSGSIWVNDEEIQQIADLLQVSQVDFIQTSLFRINNRLSIRERYADGEYFCIFFDGLKKQCSIYAARPSQCREFPFWKHYWDRMDELFKECPGVKLIE